MARNEEKAQSMLYRFREAQAAELGLGTRADKRPRMASACTSLRECERWRGDILREISRKVSKIQDSGLTDYEIRDLNDEINRLLREKRHWENQIVSLGGANYRRNVAMLDDDGREVPGTKGYKYFGRAKDLPGVRELFQSKKIEEEEENAIYSHYKKFLNPGEEYYGSWEVDDGNEAEEEVNEWEEGCANVKGALGLPADAMAPDFPLRERTNQTKHPGRDDSGPMDVDADATATKKSKGQGKAKGKGKLSKEEKIAPVSNPSSSEPTTKDSAPLPNSEAASDPRWQAAQMAATYIPFLTPEELMSPKLPSREEMEAILLALRKQSLLNEYFGETKA